MADEKATAPAKGKPTAAEQAASVDSRIEDLKHSTLDGAFKEQLENLKVEIRATIWRPNNGWLDPMYVFQYRKLNGKWSDTAFVPWVEGGKTFDDVLKFIGSSK